MIRTYRGPVHQANIVITRGGITPNDIRTSVVVAIGYRVDFEGRSYAVNIAIRHNARTVHQAGINISCGRVAPEHVRLAVVIKVTHTHDGPRGAYGVHILIRNDREFRKQSSENRVGALFITP